MITILIISIVSGSIKFLNKFFQDFLYNALFIKQLLSILYLKIIFQKHIFHLFNNDDFLSRIINLQNSR